jgi:hypothetical protein
MLELYMNRQRLNQKDANAPPGGLFGRLSLGGNNAPGAGVSGD